MALGGLVDTVEFRSNLWFPIRVKVGGAGGGSSGGALAIIRPRAAVLDSDGNEIFSEAPAGDPASVPLIPILLLLIGLLLISWAVLK